MSTTNREVSSDGDSGSRTRIGIAVVEVAGRFLVGTRGSEGPLAGYAEFPGGKCFPGETAEACAIRECEEETSLKVSATELLLHRQYEYAHGAVDLHFFLCHPVASDCILEEYRGFRWVPREELSALKFPQANAPLIRMLAMRA